jgi:hypothetical protein
MPIGTVLPIAVLFELGTLTWRLWGNIFVYPATPLAAHDSFSLRYNWVSTNYPGMYSYTVPLIRAQSAEIEGYENVQVRRGAVTTTDDSSYRGELFLENGPAVGVRSWSMARITASVAVDSTGTLVLNQNYFKGWKATIEGLGGKREQLALAGPTGLVTVPVYEGDRDVTLYYRPGSFVWGAWISFLSWTTCIVILVLSRSQSLAHSMNHKAA